MNLVLAKVLTSFACNECGRFDSVGAGPKGTQGRNENKSNPFAEISSGLSLNIVQLHLRFAQVGLLGLFSTLKLFFLFVFALHQSISPQDESFHFWKFPSGWTKLWGRPDRIHLCYKCREDKEIFWRRSFESLLVGSISAGVHKWPDIRGAFSGICLSFGLLPSWKFHRSCSSSRNVIDSRF